MAPLSRVGWEDKPEIVDALFPGVTPFSRTWLVRFPARFADGTPVVRAGARELVVRFAGPLGVAEARFVEL